MNSHQQPSQTDLETLHQIDAALKNSAKNLSCLCGSGKKFKKCCRRKLAIERQRYRDVHGV